MFCSQCGKKLDRDARFCVYCGKEAAGAESARASVPSVEQKVSKSPKGKNLLFGACGTALGAIFLAVIFLIMGVISFGGTTIEGSGFATPEDAAKAYLKGLRDQDLDAMLSVFAVESYAAHYDFEAMVEWLASYQPNLEMRLPGTNEYTGRLNIEMHRNQIVNQIITQYMAYNASDELNDYKPVILEDPAELKEFVEKFENDTQDYVFADIQITGAMQPEDLSEMYLVEQNQQNIARQAMIYGVNTGDVANVVITFEADGQEWIFCPQAIRYDGKWYLQSLQGNIAILLNMSPYTVGIAPADAFDFE